MNKTLAIVLIVVGILIVLVDVFAAPLHLGSAYFGLKKIALLVFGIIVAGVGLWGTFSKAKPKAS